jgi:LmbE family N-acetylglucosaminyl deacetylase
VQTSGVKLLFIHAHFDDFEFTAAGTFELWRRKAGEEVQRRVIICTDGEAGHHLRTREETGLIRMAEQVESARIGGYEFMPLRLRNGEVPREACLIVMPDLLAALWKAIRDFRPDYLFCPPLPADPLAGVHIDHVAVAEAVRKVAYMINVPHAFTPEYPQSANSNEWIKTPVILHVYDPYTAGTNSHDLAVDVESVFDRIADMSWCHQSQIREWLPWVARHKIELAHNREEWGRILRKRFEHKNRDLGIGVDRALEVFTVSGWGTVPGWDQLAADLPGLCEEASNLERLKAKLQRLGTV